MFVYIPSSRRFEDTELTPNKALEQRILKIWSDLGVGYVSLAKFLMASKDPISFYAKNDHFTADGYEQSAKRIIDHIERNGCRTT